MRGVTCSSYFLSYSDDIIIEDWQENGTAQKKKRKSESELYHGRFFPPSSGQLLHRQVIVICLRLGVSLTRAASAWLNGTGPVYLLHHRLLPPALPCPWGLRGSIHHFNIHPIAHNFVTAHNSFCRCSNWVCSWLSNRTWRGSATAVVCNLWVLWWSSPLARGCLHTSCNCNQALIAGFDSLPIACLLVLFLTILTPPAHALGLFNFTRTLKIGNSEYRKRPTAENIAFPYLIPSASWLKCSLKKVSGWTLHMPRILKRPKPELRTREWSYTAILH